MTSLVCRTVPSLLVCVLGILNLPLHLTKFKHFNTVKSLLYATKPNATVQAPVQPGVFTHDCSVLLTVPPPLSGKYIHGGRVGEGRGKKEEKSTTCEQQTSSSHFTLGLEL